MLTDLLHLLKWQTFELLSNKTFFLKEQIEKSQHEKTVGKSKRE